MEKKLLNIIINKPSSILLIPTKDTTIQMWIYAVCKDPNLYLHIPEEIKDEVMRNVLIINYQDSTNRGVYQYNQYMIESL